MSTQNNAAQAAAQILTYLGFAQAVSMEPGVDRRRDHIQALIESALLYQLRAPVSDIREGFELTYAADADDPACASDLAHFTNGWRACIMSQVRAPVADERAAFEKRFSVPPENWTKSGGGGYRNIWIETRWEGWRARAALASAPVAEQAALSAQSATKDDKAALGLPECGKPLCAPGEHHPLCRHGWAEKKAASAPVAGDGKTRVPGDQLGGPAAAWDDGAQSDPNRPESRASIESKGGALAPVAGEADDEEATDAWRRLALQFDGHRMQALGHLRAMLADPQAHAERAAEFLAAPPLSGEQVLAERIRALAAPQASEAVGDCNLEHARNLPEVECWACELKVISSCGSKGCPVNDGYAGLSAQPADKPAISSPSSAGNPCPTPVPAYPQTGKPHTDGGAVYG